MRALLRLAMLGLVIITAHSHALADPSPSDPAAVKLAKRYVDAGLAAQEAHDYDTAISLYSKAYRVVPHPLLIFNMAQAHRLAGHQAAALTLYRRYLDEDPKGAQAHLARAFVRELAREVEERAAQSAPRTPGHPSEEGTGDDAASAPAIRAGKAENEPDEGARGRSSSTGEAVSAASNSTSTSAPSAIVADAPPSSSRSTSRWKWSLGVSLSVAVTSGAFVFVSGELAARNAKEIIPPPGSSVISDNDCGKSATTLGLTGHSTLAFHRACAWYRAGTVGTWLSAAALVSSAVSLVMVVRSGSSEQGRAGSRSRQREIAIAPLAAPGGGGAALSLTW